MSAFTPPRAALRGGNQSDDSFAISRRIFVPSVALCLLAVKRQGIAAKNNTPTHMGWDWGSLRCLSDVAFEAWLSYRSVDVAARDRVSQVRKPRARVHRYYDSRRRFTDQFVPVWLKSPVREKPFPFSRTQPHVLSYTRTAEIASSVNVSRPRPSMRRSLSLGRRITLRSYSLADNTAAHVQLRYAIFGQSFSQE